MPVRFATFLLLLSVAATGFSQSIPKLHVEGKNLVDPNGKVVSLRGCNLGNWLIIELWMLALSEKAGVGDQYELFQTLDQRFGQATRERLIDEYRSSWITDKDFDVIKSFRFNVVRLPLEYRLFEDDAHPKVLRKDAFKWTDRCIEMARRHGIYVILDMHGLQGGQSPYDHTGRSGQNHFWDVPSNQDRAAWLWKEIAKRYRDENVVVAYDLGNEPYGGTHALQRPAYTKLYNAVREADPQKLVYFMGHYDGFEHYGSPQENHWSNVGYQMHWYPGMFGNGTPTLNVHVRHLNSLEPTVATIDKWQAPFLVGEMNPVFAKVGVDMMRRHYDAYAAHGWATTMWSYKVMTDKGGFDGGSWGMVTNSRPAPTVNFKTASLAEIQKYFDTVRDMKWEVYESLRETMAPEVVNLPPLPAEVPRRVTVPSSTDVAGWQVADIGGALPGSVVMGKDGLELYGAGGDIWGDKDAFRFLYQEVRGDFVATVQVNSMDDWETYAKSGWMVRSSLDADAPHVLASAVPDGSVQFAERKKAGGTTDGQAMQNLTFPLILKLTRHHDTFVASAQEVGKDPVEFGRSERPDLRGKVLLGLVALSHDPKSYCRVVYVRPTVMQGDGR